MAARRRFRWLFVALAVVAVVLVLWLLFHKKKGPPPPPPQVPVNTAVVTSQDVPVTVAALGAAQAWRSDTIVAQVTGIILRMPFKEGDKVRAGQLLAQIDPAPYQAALTQAQGSLRRDEALLAEAKMDLARYQVLAAQNSIARQTAEDQGAVVKQDEGVVLLDQGAVAAAKVNLDRCRITSPISGRIGVRLVDPGNLVGSGASANSTNGSASTSSSTSGSTTGGASSAAGNAGSVTGGTTGSTGIAVVNELEPIAITFTVPQQDFAKLVSASDGFRKPLVTQAYSQDTNQLIATGSLQIADNKVDPSTGTVQLKAQFANADERIWPGQYVDVKLTLQTLQQVPAIPAGAVNQGPQGAYVYVVVSGKAQMRPVKVMTTEGGVTAVQSGLKVGETVVTDGQMTLKNGSAVRVVPQGKAAPAAGAPVNAAT
jgi:multidrug efflux system membrane fusion protein